MRDLRFRILPKSKLPKIHSVTVSEVLRSRLIKIYAIKADLERFATRLVSSITGSKRDVSSEEKR